VTKKKKLSFTDEYMKMLDESLPKDKEVVSRYLSVAAELVEEVTEQISSDEDKSKLIVELYYMLRSQEKYRLTNEYYFSTMAKGSLKDLLPSDFDKGDKSGGFGSSFN